MLICYDERKIPGESAVCFRRIISMIYLDYRFRYGMFDYLKQQYPVRNHGFRYVITTG